ncbi:hypothetical protein GCM10027215_26580 [Nocardioides zeae]
MEHGGVLDGCVGDDATRAAPAPGEPEQAPVHRLRAGSREGDLVGSRPEAGGDDLPRVVEELPCAAARVVESSGVGVPVLVGEEQRLAGRRVEGARRRAVEVDPRR